MVKKMIEHTMPMKPKPASDTTQAQAPKTQPSSKLQLASNPAHIESSSHKLLTTVLTSVVKEFASDLTAQTIGTLFN